MAGKNRQSPQGSNRSAGTASSGDPTTTTGQYGPDLVGGFGVPSSSGAAGSAGALAEPDSVNQPGQVPDSIFGMPTGLTSTGAPGTGGRTAGEGYGEVNGARTTDIGSTIYGQSEADHQLVSDDVPRYNGDYNPEHGAQLPSLSAPAGTGAPGSSGQGDGAGTSGGSGGRVSRMTGKGGNFGNPHPNQGK